MSSIASPSNLATVAPVVLLAALLAEWLSWRLKLPSILLLLLAGIVVGPVTGLVSFDEASVSTFDQFVFLTVAVILFAEGLTLKLSRIKHVGLILVSLLTLGTALNWLALAAAAYYFLYLELEIALLFAAVLVVTGPTVITPLLREIRLKSPLIDVLRWESALIDPLGVIWAVLVFEVLIENTAGPQTAVLMFFSRTLLAGLGIGGVFSLIAVLVLRHSLLPGRLSNVFALTMALVAFAIANEIQRESGLITVTVMGIALANVRSNVTVHRIHDFKGSLSGILISSLFILLAAQLDPGDLGVLDLNFFFFMLLLFAARLVSVLIASSRSRLDWRERLFIGLVAPRGIVTAAIVSMFASELIGVGYYGAYRLVPLTFAVVAVTVSFCGLSAGFLARWLGVQKVGSYPKHFDGIDHISNHLQTELRSKGIKLLVLEHGTSALTGPPQASAISKERPGHSPWHRDGTVRKLTKLSIFNEDEIALMQIKPSGVVKIFTAADSLNYGDATAAAEVQRAADENMKGRHGADTRRKSSLKKSLIFLGESKRVENLPD